MPYDPENNPYVPGDPYSYDLKWMVKDIKHMEERFGELDSQVQEATDQADRAQEEADRAVEEADRSRDEADRADSEALVSEGYAKGTQDGEAVASGSPYFENNSKYYSEEAATSAQEASDSAADAADYAAHIADPVSGLVTQWLNDNVDPGTGYVIDDTLSIQMAAADAKTVGGYVRKPAPLECVQLGQAGSTSDNYALYDGSATAVMSFEDPARIIPMPTFTAPSNNNGVMRLIDNPWRKTVTAGVTYQYGIYVKLKAGTTATFHTHFSNGPAWGGAYGVSIEKDISVSKSGYYIITKAPTVGASAVDLNLKWMGVSGADLQYVDFVAFFPIEMPVDNIANDNTVCDIAFWGDSLTAGAGGGGTTFPAVVASILGKSYRNYGVGGEISNTIAARMGANSVIIPAGPINGTYNDGFTDIFGGLVQPILGGNPYNSGSEMYINGQPCTLAAAVVAGQVIYTISGYTGGTSPVDLIGTFRRIDDDAEVTVIFVGTNGSTMTGETGFDAKLAIIDSMIAKLKNNKYLIMGLTAGSTAASETNERKMLKKYGDKYFNSRTEVAYKGLDLEGITPTAADNTAIAAGSVPPSLLSDSVHLNAAGYDALGKLVAEKITALRYFK